MDMSNTSQAESSYATLELFPKNKRAKKCDPTIPLKKKKKVKQDPEPLQDETIASDAENSASSDCDGTTDQRPEVNILGSTPILPTVLHALKNGPDVLALAYEEIALEGLDGITLEALWTRLRCTTDAHFNDTLKIFIWNKLKDNYMFRFYELPEKRLKLEVYKRFDNEQQDDASCAIEEADIQDIYSIESTKIEGVFGACDSISTRTDITDKIVLLTRKEVEVCYGNKLAIVADHKLRSLNLFTEFHDEYIPGSYSEILYRLLEKIGRSRVNGEITCTKTSIGMMCKDSKSLCYYRNMLEDLNVIVSQQVSFINEGQNQTGYLLQLQRFYSEKKLKKHRVIEYLVNLLKAQPKFLISYTEFLKRIGHEQWLKLKGRSIMKSPELNALVSRTFLPFRVVFPNAKPERWKKKDKNDERTLLVLQLKDPSVNLQQYLSKEDPASDDSSDNETVQSMPISSCLANVAYRIVYDAGPEGLSLKDFIKTSGIDYYASRKLLTHLFKRKVIVISKFDNGSQRIKNYVAAHFSHQSPNKVVAETPSQFENCDDDTIDFIANVLHVDADNKHHLQRCTVLEPSNVVIDNSETAMGQYKAIKLMRQMNIMPAECKVLYENKHQFEKVTITPQKDITVQLEKPSMTVDNNIRDLFNRISPTSSASYDRVYFNDFVIIDSKLRNSTVEFPKRKIRNEITFHHVKKIEEFYVILEKHNLLLTITKQPNFKIIFNKTSKLINKMHSIKALEDYNSNLSDDDDDDDDATDIDDNFSLIVNFENYEEVYRDVSEIEDIITIKNMIISYFEIEDINLSSYLRTIENEVGYKDVQIETKKRSLSNDEDNLIVVKQPKLDPRDDLSLVPNSGNTIEMLPSHLDFGPKPIFPKVIHCPDYEAKIIVSSELEKYADPEEVFTDASLTSRVLERSTIIIDFIRFNKIVTDTKLVHHVQMIEKMRGYNTRLDKKTLFRIISRLITLGFIRSVKLLLKVKKFCRSKLMFFLPDFVLFPYLNDTIEATAFSLRTYAKRKTSFLMNNPNTNITMPCKYVPVNPNFKSSRSVSYRYGYLQKFSRLQLMHQFMYYLVYDYSDVPNCVPIDLTRHFDDEDAVKQLPEIYKNEVSWKMFIPSLPHYEEYPDGWVYLGDIVMRLPLSIFVRVCSVMYIIPELSDYLNHPVKRHLLVKDLPLSIVEAMYCNRRYVDIIFPMFCYLSYMGLLQFGPKCIRTKFDMFVYVNRRALIYDTTTSEPGYHEVTDTEYEQLTFYFNSEEEITRYWSTLCSIGARSKLGSRYSILGKMITLVNIHNNPSMIETMAPVTHDAAAGRDVGYIPGNKRGACGYDSGLWIHVRRNWTSTKSSKSKDTRTTDLKPQHMFKDQADAKQTNLHPSRTKKILVKMKAGTFKRKLSSTSKVAVKSTKKVIRRVVKPRNVTKVRTREKDELDKELQQTYSGARAKFNSTELLALSVCLEVLKYLKYAKHGVSMICIRDFMHRVCKNVSYKKTSSAYRRRLLLIEGSARDLCAKDNLFSTNLNSDHFAQKHYKLFIKRLETKKVSDAEIKIAFLYLAYFTMSRQQTEKSIDSFKNRLNNTTVKNIELLDYQAYSTANYVTPRTKDDIKCDTLQSLIHCCLTCVVNVENWRPILYKAFQSYSEEAIRSCVKNMQVQQILSSSKGHSNPPASDGVLLVTGKSYHLSFAYSFNQITIYPNIIFPKALETFQSVYSKAQDDATRILIEPYENDNMLALFEVSSIQTLKYEIEQSTDILTINPLISDHTVLIKELVRRCGIIVRNILVESAAANDEGNLSLQNVENIISTLINSDSSEPLEGAKIIENIVENTQYLDKDVDDEHVYPTYDSKSMQSTQSSLEVDKNQSRTMSIYSLKGLLTKGLFPELDDDEKLEELENHFTPKFPNIWLDVPCSTEFMSIAQPIENLSTIIDEMERDAVYNPTIIPENLELHFVEEDFVIAQSLVDFILTKEIFGASLLECYNLYEKFATILSFETIMEKLIKLKYIMIHGVTSLTAIHINFIETWTNHLHSKLSVSKYIDSTIANYRVKLMPWIKVDGTVHVDALENWMCIILSHCLSFSQATVQSIVNRFPYMKPVDTFTILKIIQRLGCISLNTYKTAKITTLFSESDYIQLIPAPFHCDIPSLTISVESCAILKLGQALKDIKTI